MNLPGDPPVIAIIGAGEMVPPSDAACAKPAPAFLSHSLGAAPRASIAFGAPVSKASTMING
jgi:hypothetical protein